MIDVADPATFGFIQEIKQLNAERMHAADLVRQLITEVRKGECYLLQEKLGHLAFLLEHPGWPKCRPTNQEAIDA